MNTNYESQNLTHPEALVELDDNELDVISGGDFWGGQSTGQKIHNGIRNGVETVGGFLDGLIFG